MLLTILTIALGVAAGLLLAAFILNLLLRILAGRLLALLFPRTPNAATMPDCSVPNDPATVRAIGPGVTGGVIRGQQLTVPAGTTLNITSDLTIISNNNLQIDGDIVAANPGANPGMQGGFMPNITLVSQNGNVVIGPNAEIGFKAGMVLPAVGVAAGASIRGAPGRTGGYVKIVSPNGFVANQGTIIGMPGTDGERANDTAAGGMFGVNTASSASGGGGSGGNVLICAKDSIINDGWIAGGGAGSGGTASATALAGAQGDAVGGDGGTGGTVRLHGLINPGRTGVTNNATIQAGVGGRGGSAIATGGAGGGDARANAGHAGQGGTIEFVSVEMAVVGTLNPASGGDGGVATATGMAGANGVLWGDPGGSAIANGGDGGPDGLTGPIPVPAGAAPGVWGAPVVGRPGHTGAGGNATATAGNGGNGRRRGGPSGTRSATGGTGKGGTAATPAPPPPIVRTPPAGGTGGVGGTSTSTGTP